VGKKRALKSIDYLKLCREKTRIWVFVGICKNRNDKNAIPIKKNIISLRSHRASQPVLRQ
jgi:hypothetical protein